MYDHYSDYLSISLSMLAIAYLWEWQNAKITRNNVLYYMFENNLSIFPSNSTFHLQQIK